MGVLILVDVTSSGNVVYRCVIRFIDPVVVKERLVPECHQTFAPLKLRTTCIIACNQNYWNKL